MVDVNRAQSKVDEYVRRNREVGAIINSRRESLGDAHESGLERVLETYAANNEVDEASLEDIDPDDFVDQNFQKRYAEGVTDHLVNEAAAEIGVDPDDGSIEEHQLLQMYTGATKSEVEANVKQYIAQQDRLEDLTSDNLARHLRENIEQYSEVEQNLRQYTISHADQDDVEDIVAWTGTNDIIEAQYLPVQAELQIGEEYHKEGDVQPETATATAVQSQAPYAVKSENLDEQVQDILSRARGNVDVTEDYTLN